jgi:hypothetical protein
VTLDTLAQQVVNFLHVAEQCHALQLKEYCCYFLGVNAAELNVEQFLPLVSHFDWMKRIQRHRWPPMNTVVHDGPFFRYSSIATAKSKNNHNELDLPRKDCTIQ